ncbi:MULTISPECIES: hypothetical protein [Luteimonas]|uniref:hypothetical protein n=1 Tax=Luteimonas TaxID=83614 RepID=UPI00117D3863|nr:MULTISPECIES: hypothetical protein [Luteimonas]
MQKTPKKKSGTLVIAARARAGDLAALRRIGDPDARLRGESRFQRQYIQRELLAKEPLLQQSTWIEYGYLTPMERTELFAEEFREASLHAYAKYVDLGVRLNREPLEASFGKNSVAEMNSLWKARQKADELGVPYDLFVETLLEGKMTGDKWKRPPRPNQLLSGKHTEARLRGRPTWKEVSDRLFLPHWDRRFFAPRAVDDPVQAAAMQALRNDVLRASDRPQRLARYLGLPGLLSLKCARTLFTSDIVEESLALGPFVEADESTEGHEYRPACFGNRSVTRGSPCCNCVVATACASFRRKVTQMLVEATGSSDPRLAHRRRVDRERQRKHRHRKRRQRTVAASP